MKKLTKLTILIALISLLFLVSLSSAGTFLSGSTGADGAFNPTANTEVQLPADGILNYTTVNIPSGVTVTFKKNSSNTPVYILATGDVTISGAISVNGAGASGIYPGDSGVGGFKGGHGGVQNVAGGKGLGPGGGNQGNSSNNGGGGGFGTSGSTGGTGVSGGGTYGNERIIPMIGGSGGGGGGGNSSSTCGAGGGGGGAILIASSGTITVSGSITSSGGSGADGPSYIGGGGGSGGAIRLIANTISGNGTISANGGSRGGNGGAGGNGRIRIETYNLTRTSGTSPTYSFGLPGSVFVANTPSLQITSIGGTSVPSGAAGSYTAPDITLPSNTTNPVSIGISAANIPVGTSISVYAMPQFGSASSTSVTLSGTDSSSTATASLSISTSYTSVIMAWTTFTVQTAMYYEGEKIEKVRVSATIGKGSEVTYITESGKEIPSEKLMASNN